MQEVGIRELKSHLSSYLRLVQKGEVVSVRHRGRLIARINRLTSLREKEPVENRLVELKAKGWITSIGNSGKRVHLKPVLISGETIATTVSKLRERHKT